MIAILHSVITTVGDIGSGGESSPLSVNSQFAELLRLVQVGIFAGVMYLIKGLKDNKNASDETHGTIRNDIVELTAEIKRQRQERKAEIQVLREEVAAITTRKQEQAERA